MTSEESSEELIKIAQEQLSLVAKKIDEALPRTRRKRSKKVKTDGPILAEDLGLEVSEEVGHERR